MAAQAIFPRDSERRCDKCPQPECTPAHRHRRSWALGYLASEGDDEPRPGVRLSCGCSPSLSSAWSQFSSTRVCDCSPHCIERVLQMKQFTSIEKLDTGILYTLELASSVSVLLLAFGLIASMANVLTKGAILTDNLIMQRI